MRRTIVQAKHNPIDMVDIMKTVHKPANTVHKSVKIV